MRRSGLDDLPQVCRLSDKEVRRSRSTTRGRRSPSSPTDACWTSGSRSRRRRTTNGSDVDGYIPNFHSRCRRHQGTRVGGSEVQPSGTEVSMVPGVGLGDVRQRPHVGLGVEPARRTRRVARQGPAVVEGVAGPVRDTHTVYPTPRLTRPRFVLGTGVRAGICT